MQELIITSKELVLYYPIKFSFFIFHNIKISHIVSFVSKKGTEMLMVPGMIFTIEPMINMGSKNVVFEKDGWTVRTKDRKCSAHFEHCIAIRPDGPQILSSFEFVEEVLGNNAI